MTICWGEGLVVSFFPGFGASSVSVVVVLVSGGAVTSVFDGAGGKVYWLGCLLVGRVVSSVGTAVLSVVLNVV